MLMLLNMLPTKTIWEWLAIHFLTDLININGFESVVEHFVQFAVTVEELTITVVTGGFLLFNHLSTNALLLVYTSRVGIPDDQAFSAVIWTKWDIKHPTKPNPKPSQIKEEFRQGLKTHRHLISKQGRFSKHSALYEWTQRTHYKCDFILYNWQ